MLMTVNVSIIRMLVDTPILSSVAKHLVPSILLGALFYIPSNHSGN